MTGELCDCFATKAEGVDTILDAVVAAAGGREIRVYQTDARFVDVATARDNALKTAASNWVALAVLAAELCGDGTGLMIDIGSTTTDIIGLAHGRARPGGATDSERLARGELVYTGVGRTPICALLRKATWRGRSCRLATELFATTLDAYLYTGEIAEDPENLFTADGRPATHACARDRLARMFCADRTEAATQDIDRLARAAIDAQLDLLAAAVDEVASRLDARPETIVISGSGEFLARRLVMHQSIACRVIALSERYGVAASHAACAFALARLVGKDVPCASS
jgi:probable H4MPT-linked C1 transfer pathway protein